MAHEFATPWEREQAPVRMLAAMTDDHLNRCIDAVLEELLALHQPQPPRRSLS